MRRAGSVISAMAAVAVVLVVGAAPDPAGATTFSVTGPDMCGGAGSFMQALADANAHPGPDVIDIAPGLRIEAWTCNSLRSPIFGYPLSATESVEIVGNGSTFVGGQVYIDPSGRVNDPNRCPQRSSGILAASASVGILEVGTYAADNTGIAVNVHGLNMSGMPSLFLVERNASLSITDAKADNTLSFNDDCSRPPIQSTDGNVSLTRVVLTDSSAPATLVDDAMSGVAVVAGYGSGALTMERVVMAYNFSGRAVYWRGSSVKIVSSQIFDSGGLWLDATSSRIVNTAFRTHRAHAVDRVIATNGVLRTDASTFFWSEPVCDGCALPNLGMAVGGTATIDLHTTAIGAGVDFPGAAPLLWGNTATGFTSDTMTWVQPSGTQDPAALTTILPGARTGAPGLNTSWATSFATGAISDVTPLLGTLATPGVLIDGVSDAACTAPDDANRLIDPIDSSCITTDVFGRPRWDSGNHRRNIGAVQNVDTPHLAVTAVGDGTVDLQWNRPMVTTPVTISGYAILHRPVGSGPYTRVDVPGADVLAHRITGLTNGTDSEFVMIAVLSSGDGPESNTVQATPFGPVGAPAVGAVAGVDDVRLYWTAPTSGGHPDPLRYFVVIRPVGTTDWISGPGFLSARTADIPGLDCGVTYEFGVAAVAADGAAGPIVGSTTATPTASCPPTPPIPDGAVPRFTG